MYFLLFRMSLGKERHIVQWHWIQKNNFAILLPSSGIEPCPLERTPSVGWSYMALWWRCPSLFTVSSCCSWSSLGHPFLVFMGPPYLLGCWGWGSCEWRVGSGLGGLVAACPRISLMWVRVMPLLMHLTSFRAITHYSTIELEVLARGWRALLLMRRCPPLPPPTLSCPPILMHHLSLVT